MWNVKLFHTWEGDFIGIQGKRGRKKEREGGKNKCFFLILNTRMVSYTTSVKSYNKPAR